VLGRRFACGGKKHAEQSCAVQLNGFNPIEPWAFHYFSHYLTQGLVAVNKKLPSTEWITPFPETIRALPENISGLLLFIRP
jgi:hypothetical protein